MVEAGNGGAFFLGRSQITPLNYGRSPNYTLELSQKSDFQLSTTKPNNIDHPTVETGQIWPLGWFPKWFRIFLK